MTPELDPNLDWSLCTPEGQEMDELRHWSALPLMAKLRALEEMCDHSRATIAWRRSEGLPYIDPFTGELVKGGRVAEAPVSTAEASKPRDERAGNPSTDPRP